MLSTLMREYYLSSVRDRSEIDWRNDLSFIQSNKDELSKISIENFNFVSRLLPLETG